MAFHTKCRHRKLNDGNVDPHSILVRLVKKIESQHSDETKTYLLGHVIFFCSFILGFFFQI